MTYDLPDGTTIYILDAPHFLATKIEAFQGRGYGDFFASKDVEDILMLVDGRVELIAEVNASPMNIRSFIGDTFAKWSRDRDFRDAVLGFSEDREAVILARVGQLAAFVGES